MNIKELLKNKENLIKLKGGSITKVFRNNDVVLKYYDGYHKRGYEKLKSEVNYLNKVPKDLKNIFPKIIETFENDSIYAFTIPYYSNFNSFSVLLYGKTNIEKIKKNIIKIFEFSLENIYSNKSEYIENYFEKKHINRLKESVECFKSNEILNEIFQKDKIIFNNEELINLNEVIKLILKDKSISKLINSSKFSFFHGNYHLDNILSNGKEFIFIDPRGETLGDMFYDLGKFFIHMISGYDEIHVGDFQLENINNKYSLKLTNHYVKDRYDKIYELFKDFFINSKDQDNLKKLNIIGGIHAISFTSYHLRKENPNIDRCLAYYFCGLKLLNAVIKKKYIKEKFVPYS